MTQSQNDKIDAHTHIFRNGIDNVGDFILCECGYKRYSDTKATEAELKRWYSIEYDNIVANNIGDILTFTTIDDKKIVFRCIQTPSSDKELE